MLVDGNESKYIYDNLYQLVSADYPAAWGVADVNYYYDALGSRTSTCNGSTTTYSRNNLNQYTSVGGTNYSYDDNGNLADINNGQFQYVYDCENRLIEAKENSVTVATYVYDYAGRRVGKTAGGVTTRYVYDGDQIIAEYQGETLVRKFVYGPGIDEPILMINVSGETETKYYYHIDGLGSVVALSDTSGNIVERYSYDVFGEPNRTSSIGNRFMFTGREYDSETGNYYYRARYYRPEIGRFLQTDPIGYLAGLNLYTYCENNPIGLVDPWGLCVGRAINAGDEYLKQMRDWLIGENSGAAWLAAFSEPWGPGPTGGFLPESQGRALVNIWGQVPGDAFKNGMHAWHAGSNAYLGHQYGVVGMPLIFAGGLYHESLLDYGSFMAEQEGQGTVNHILDSATDIVANYFGLIVGAVLPGDAGVEAAIEYGNYIPGPGEPDPAFGGGGGVYVGNPTDAWGQYPE